MAVKRVSLSGHKGSVKIADPNNPTDVVEVGSISNTGQLGFQQE